MTETNKEKTTRLEGFYDEVRRLVRELGDTNVIMKIKIENLLKEYRNG